MAGFEVITYGRFWVIVKDYACCITTKLEFVLTPPGNMLILLLFQDETNYAILSSWQDHE